MENDMICQHDSKSTDYRIVRCEIPATTIELIVSGRDHWRGALLSAARDEVSEIIEGLSEDDVEILTDDNVRYFNFDDATGSNEATRNETF